MQQHFPNQVLNKAITNEAVTKRLLLDAHRLKMLNVDIQQRNAEVLGGRLDVLRDDYTLAMQEFWPCTIYPELDRMIQKSIHYDEPHRGRTEKVEVTLAEVRERMGRQSMIAKELMARENAYRGHTWWWICVRIVVMTIEQLRNDMDHLDKTLNELRSRIYEDEDRLNQLTMDYQKSLSMWPPLRYCRLKKIIQDAIQ